MILPNSGVAKKNWWLLVDDNSSEKKISKISSREAKDRLEKGKEFAGVRKKDTAYGNAKAIKEQSVILSPDTLKRKSRVEKEDKSDKSADYDEKEEATDRFRYNQTDSEIEKKEDIQSTKK